MPHFQPLPFVAREFSTPCIVVSACIEMNACRHDGQRIPDSFIERLARCVHILPICPEIEIGLGVPRDAIRLVDDGKGVRLVQPSSGSDLSDSMHAFAQHYLDQLGEVDGFILKSRSPSCGIQDARVYPRAERSPALRQESGLFAQHVLRRHDHLAIESEGRLRNYPIRHHFLTRIYAFAELRDLGENPSGPALTDFQRRHKHLLMTYNQNKMRELGAIAADAASAPAPTAYQNYASTFREALAKMPTHESWANSLQHMYGHFKHKISPTEKVEFLSLLERYRAHQLPLYALLAVLRTWCTRFEYHYFADQSLLEPYPNELVEMRDSGKGVDF
jgi:uncharacterized protein YbgA (DUF1722 family)/uncharacterized protein YbbK (DUF523 family)